MTIETAAGATLAISAATPATEDSAGYGALTFTNVGEIETVPEFGGTSQIITFAALDDVRTRKLKGTFDGGDISVSVGQDPNDAGQNIARTAAEATNNQVHSFRVELASGRIKYFQGLVTGMTDLLNDVNSVVRSNMNVAIIGGVVNVSA